MPTIAIAMIIAIVATATYVMIAEVIEDSLNGTAEGAGVAEADFTVIAVSAYELP